MSEIECPQCGHRALSVATRCPRCGEEFPPNLIQPLPSTAERHWVRWSLMGAVALALLILIGKFGRYESASTGASRTAAAPARESVATVVDTAPRDSASRKASPPAVVPPRPLQKPPPQAQQPPPQQRPPQQHRRSPNPRRHSRHHRGPPYPSAINSSATPRCSSTCAAAPAQPRPRWRCSSRVRRCWWTRSGAGGIGL